MRFLLVVFVGVVVFRHWMYTRSVFKRDLPSGQASFGQSVDSSEGSTIRRLGVSFAIAFRVGLFAICVVIALV